MIHSIGDRCHKEKTKTKKNKETRLVMRAGPERKKNAACWDLSLCACQGSRRGGTHLGGSSVLEGSQCVSFATSQFQATTGTVLKDGIETQNNKQRNSAFARSRTVLTAGKYEKLGFFDWRLGLRLPRVQGVGVL